MSYNKIDLNIVLSVDEKQFYSIKDKFFKKISKIKDYDSTEQKFSFDISEQRIILNAVKSAKGLNWLSHRKIHDAINYLVKYTDDNECEKIGSIYSSQTNNVIEMVAFKNILYCATKDEVHNTMNIVDSKNNSVDIKLPDETTDIRVDLNVLAAHFIFNGTDNKK
ncbi:hypothetical protein [Bacillus pseudomycoides]|uniref:hypothetical protein n=1 Tax=Bacillus pseudomycoides TaxID=64104 RepID=UPI000BF0A61D|nr:hypothetical protein [Bacillus pseudomycoides]PEM69362.1 hypothetical protein CN619_21755 [Bacillus pseudomycoides]PGA62166.1 hypothetical protein COL84_13400 [Bacillus pseudomycoides]